MRRNFVEGPVRVNTWTPNPLPDPFSNNWGNSRAPNPGGAAIFPYQTQLVERRDMLGAHYHMAWHPSPFGSPPMMVLPHVQTSGTPIQAPTLYATPLSTNPIAGGS